MGRALAEVIEAAHDTSPPDAEWLTRLTAAMHAHVGLPMLRAGVGYAWERHESSYRATLTVASGDPTALTWTAAHDVIPRAWLRAMYGSGPIAIFVSDVATQRSAAIPPSLRDVWRRGGGDDPFGMVAPLDHDRGFAVSVLPERPVHRLGSVVLQQIRQRWSSVAALVASGARVRRALRSGAIAAELDAVGGGDCGIL